MKRVLTAIGAGIVLLITLPLIAVVLLVVWICGGEGYEIRARSQAS